MAKNQLSFAGKDVYSFKRQAAGDKAPTQLPQMGRLLKVDKPKIVSAFSAGSGNFMIIALYATRCSGFRFLTWQPGHSYLPQANCCKPGLASSQTDLTHQ